MNSPHDTVSDGEVTGEELMAYLDGELGDERRRYLDERISGNPELRQKVKELQQTWDLLDELPREPVGDDFTRITVEMVAVQAESEAQLQVRRANWWRRTALLLGLAFSAVAGAAGFLWMRSQLAEPNRRLVDDLPILQQLDAYQNAESIQFLQMLDREGLFKEEGGDGN
jgi:anti-sigma factor RsiW